MSMAFEQFRARHKSTGGSMSQALRDQSDMIMNSTFDRDPAYRKVKINGQEVDAKYLVHSYKSVTTNDMPDFYLQFRPGVYYPIGTYVDVPNRDNKYERWLIVTVDDLPQFPLHYILKCNWTLKWVCEGTIYSQLVVLRSRSSYSSGVWRDYEFTTPESQLGAWMPTNDTTKTLTYDQRILISNNEKHPIAWRITNINDVHPLGLTQLVFSQSQFDPHRDNPELMIADYYDTNLNLEEKVDPPPKPYGDHSRITFNGTKQVLKVNGSYKTFTPHFYDADTNELDIEPFWSIKFPSDEDKEKFDIFEDGKNLKVKCLNYYDLIGKIITINLNDESGTMPSSIDLEVVSL